MWIVRFILLGLLIVLVIGCGIFMRRRTRYEGLFENRLVNLAVVVVYQLLCLLMAGLPSDPDVFAPPPFFERHDVRTGYSVFGLLLMGSALVLGTWDGLLMLPVIFVVNAAEAFLEERRDVGVRFHSQYREYRR